MATNYEKIFERDYQKLQEKYDKKSDEYKLLKYKYDLALSQLRTKEKQINNIREETINEYQSIINDKNTIIKEKDKEIERLKSLLNIDGTNSGIPTSMTPINKKKIIPNSRVKSDKKIGGQAKHKKHKLEKFEEKEITETERHTLDVCPCCSGKLVETGSIEKDELSYKFVVIKRRHKFITYKCENCNKEVHKNIPNHLKEENQYGSEIKSMALSLANIGNVPMNKIRKIIYGFSEHEIDMSEGFISKLQKQASDKLSKFKDELYRKILTLELLYWDDTVIMINTKRACLRFYGNEYIAFYCAHEHKGEDGINEDAILNTLSSTTKVMHDHNKINYKYDYQNLECNVHLLRDLQKCHDNCHHDWCLEFKKMIQKNLQDKKELLSKEKNTACFSDEYLNEFNESFKKIMIKATQENLEKEKTHYDQKEKALIKRILEYKDNYFLWMYDFSLPSDDNLSERGLRSVKSKMKIAGQFQNVKNAEYYANIKTYIETCNRNNINSTEALIRLMNDDPYTVEEIFSQNKR